MKLRSSLLGSGAATGRFVSPPPTGTGGGARGREGERREAAPCCVAGTCGSGRP